ncbi:hypothetical protein MK079_01500 [Candidatus Gracilibacteria bacterium]|nr:hypothetical protein [Candidatus Gracilibacteria bacterium]
MTISKVGDIASSSLGGGKNIKPVKQSVSADNDPRQKQPDFIPPQQTESPDKTSQDIQTQQKQGSENVGVILKETTVDALLARGIVVEK